MPGPGLPDGYVPTLQTGGRVFTFLHDHLGMPVASPAVFEKIGTRFRQAVARFADSNDIPVVKLTKGVRKIEVMRPLLVRAAAAASPGWRRSAVRRNTSMSGLRANVTPARPGRRSSGSRSPSAG